MDSKENLVRLLDNLKQELIDYLDMPVEHRKLLHEEISLIEKELENLK